MRAALTLALLLAAAPALGQPTGDKVDAKALMQSGLKLFNAQDYLGALAVFKDAYARFPSAKILLNIGTTEKQLDRKADAANTYQLYLDSPDTDPARRAEVTAVLAELDAAVGKLEITVTPGDAELELTDTWLPAKTAHVWRAMPGSVLVHARRDGYEPIDQTVTATAGATTQVALALVAIPKPEAKPVIITVPGEVHAEADEGPRSRIGGMSMMHVSVYPKVGSSLIIGATADLTPQLAVDVGALLGPGLVSKGTATLPPPSYGAYVGASFAFLPKPLRPRVSVGMPMFESNGMRLAVRLGGGVEYVASRRLSLIAEIGVERNLNPESDIDSTAVVPAIAATGRL